MEKYGNFENAIADIHYAFKHESYKVHTEKWQGMDISNKPEAETHELLNYNFCVDLDGQEDLQFFREDIKPNLPWADDHFLERVCGEPINPGEQWAKWPWGNSANSFRAKHDGQHGKAGQFNHNYMERYWPKHAGQTPDGSYASRTPASPWKDRNVGIRYDYGDLRDIINQLNNEPQTRQAYFPIFFPEDTGAVHGGRVPCSLGYHFIYRNGVLHINYYLRSCEVYRHFRDDCYLTVRLLLYVLDELRKLDDKWKNVIPGTYSMYITSFHCFVNDMRNL